MNDYQVREVDNRYAVVRGDDICGTFPTAELALFCIQLLTGEEA